MEKEPLLSPATTSRNNIAWHFALTVSMLLSSCASRTRIPSFEEKTPSQKNTPAEVQKISGEKIENYSRKIIEQIIEQIPLDPKFHSLQYIKSYVAHELRKSGFLSATVSAQIFPFIPNDQGTWDYLSIRVHSPEGVTEIRIGTDNRDMTLPIIDTMIRNFEYAVQQEALRAFAECIKNNENLHMGTLYSDVHEKLSEKGPTFIQHGFEYRGIEFGKDSSGKCIIKVKVYDAVNQKDIIIPIETDTELELKPQKRQHNEEPGETMIA